MGMQGKKVMNEKSKKDRFAQIEVKL